MAVKLTAHAAEEGTFHITATFTDEDSASVVPNTITWTLTDMDDATVNGRSSVSVASPATSNTITMSGTDLALIAGKRNERKFLIQWNYDSSYGSGLDSSEEAIFIIDPRGAI